MSTQTCHFPPLIIVINKMLAPMIGGTDFLLFTMATSEMFGSFVSVQLLEKNDPQSM